MHDSGGRALPATNPVTAAVISQPRPRLTTFEGYHLVRDREPAYAATFSRKATTRCGYDHHGSVFGYQAKPSTMVAELG